MTWALGFDFRLTCVVSGGDALRRWCRDHLGQQRLDTGERRRLRQHREHTLQVVVDVEAVGLRRLNEAARLFVR